MKIRTKLFSGYALVALLSAMVGVIAMQVTESFHDTFEALVEDELPIMEALHELNYSGRRVVSSTNEYVMLLATATASKGSSRERDREVRLIRLGIEQHQAAMRRYEDLVRTACREPEGKTVFPIIKSGGEELLRASRDLIAAADRGAGPNELLELKERQERAEMKFLGAVERDIAQEKSEFETNHTQLHTKIRASAQIIVTSSIVLFIVVLIAGIVISGAISRPLARLTEAAGEIAKGNLLGVPPSSSTDETGALTASFNHMAESLRQSREAVRRRLEMEKTISGISSRFIGVQDIGGAIDQSLRDIGTLSGAGRSYLFLAQKDGAEFRYAYEWCATGVEPAIGLAPTLPAEAFPWWVAKLRAGDVIDVSDVSALPAEAANEREELMRQGVKSVLVLPVMERGRLTGFAGFDNVAVASEWKDEALALLRMFTEIIGTALVRAQAEERVRRFSEEVREANEEMKNFAYIISHDLRAPLVSIKGFSAELKLSVDDILRLLERHLPSVNEQDRRNIEAILRVDVPEAVNFIGSSVDRMDKLIGSILTLSRLGRRELKPEPLDMTVVARSILDSLTHQIVERRVDVRVNDLPRISADRLAMEQILGNLIDNALKYLDPGRPAEIGILGEERPDEVLFQVRDTGRGIAGDDIPKIFEVFKRVGKQDVAGDGMGLAYVKTLVKRLGGKIWCESEPGRGSVFSFTVPRREHSEEDREGRAIS